MAITFYSPHDGVSGSWNMQSGKSYTVEVWAESDEPVGPDAVLTATNFKIGETYRWPLTGTALETHSFLFLQSINITPDGEDSLRYKLSIVFGPFDPAQQGIDDPEEGYNPYLIPPSVRWYSEDEDFYPLVDYNGTPLLNSAGDYMSDISVKIPVPTLEVSMNIEGFSPASILTLKGHLNSTTWMGFDAGVVYLSDINPAKHWDERFGDYVWSVTYVLQFKKQIVAEYSAQNVQVIPGWNLCLLDAGLRQKIDGKMIPILSEGVPTSEPLPLKADGTAVGPTDDLHFKYFDLLPCADFSTLPIPASVFT